MSSTKSRIDALLVALLDREYWASETVEDAARLRILIDRLKSPGRTEEDTVAALDELAQYYEM